MSVLDAGNSCQRGNCLSIDKIGAIEALNEHSSFARSLCGRMQAVAHANNR